MADAEPDDTDSQTQNFVQTNEVPSDPRVKLEHVKATSICPLTV